MGAIRSIPESRDPDRLPDNFVRQMVPVGTRHVHVHAEHRGRVGKRRSDVVAVADVRELQPGQRPLDF